MKDCVAGCPGRRRRPGPVAARGMTLFGRAPGTVARRGGGRGRRGGGSQVFLETVMVGNFDEKSFALAAIFSATVRATAL